jgi:hypothetical protein
MKMQVMVTSKRFFIAVSFDLVLRFASRNVQVKQDGSKLSRNHQLLVYTDHDDDGGGGGGGDGGGGGGGGGGGCGGDNDDYDCDYDDDDDYNDDGGRRHKYCKEKHRRFLKQLVGWLVKNSMLRKLSHVNRMQDKATP